jgi:hypothetical protein
MRALARFDSHPTRDTPHVLDTSQNLPHAVSSSCTSQHPSLYSDSRSSHSFAARQYSLFEPLFSYRLVTGPIILPSSSHPLVCARLLRCFFSLFRFDFGLSTPRVGPSTWSSQSHM